MNQSCSDGSQHLYLNQYGARLNPGSSKETGAIPGAMVSEVLVPYDLVVELEATSQGTSRGFCAITSDMPTVSPIPLPVCGSGPRTIITGSSRI